MKKSGFVSLLVAVAFLGLATGLPAQESTPADMLKARQVAAIAAIEQAALARGPVNSAGHASVLRESLPLLGDIAQGLFDFDKPENLAAVLAGVTTIPVDHDTRFQQRQVRYFKRLRQDIDTRIPGLANIRVVGSTAIRDPAFPAVVAIRDGVSGVCTGIYFHPGKVLTAAHCVCDLNLARPGPLHHVIFGDHFRNGRFLEGSLISQPILALGTSIFPHRAGEDSDFCRVRAQRSIPAAGTDLALITIRTQHLPAFQATQLATAVDLERTLVDDEDDIRPFFAAGFGKSNSWVDGRWQQVISGAKRGAYVLSGLACPSSGTFGGEVNRCLPGKEVSAFDASGRDTCGGDSGGPLFVRNETTSRWLLAGVTSRGLGAGDRCGQGGIYTLAFFQEARDWMVANGVIFHP